MRNPRRRHDSPARSPRFAPGWWTVPAAALVMVGWTALFLLMERMS